MGSSAPPIVELQRAGKRFSDQTLALDGIDLDVQPGELVGVVGAPGCGKSTLLRMVAGLTTPTSGVVAVRTRRIGFAFQDPLPLPWHGVRANAELPGGLDGVPRGERQRLAGEATAMVGLGECAGRPPQALPGGIRVRAWLAGSPLPRPELLLLDEPFGALDELSRHRRNDELAQLFLEWRFTGLLATRPVTEAVFLASRVVVLAAPPGRVVGTFEAPFGHPREPRLRLSGAFTRLAGEVSECLRAGATARTGAVARR